MLNMNTIVTIYNENPNKVFLPTSNPSTEYGYVCDPAYDGIPSETSIALSDVKFINSKSAIFRNGTLKFDPELEEEITKTIGIVIRQENFMSLDEIEDIILRPSKEKLERIVGINSPTTIDKVRGKLAQLDMSDDYFIAQEVYKVINDRYRELVHLSKRKSEITITKKKNEVKKEVVKKVEKETVVKETVAKEEATPKKTGKTSKAKE